MILESSFDLAFGVLIGIFIYMLINVISNYHEYNNNLEVQELKDTIFELEKRNLELENQISNLENYLMDFSKNPVYYKNTDGVARVWIVNEEDYEKIEAFDLYVDKFIKAIDEGKE